jgi:hypothetical protein
MAARRLKTMRSTTLTSSPETDNALIDADEIRRALGIFLPTGAVTEIRALDGTLRGDRYTGASTFSGYFDNLDLVASELSKLATAKAIFFVFNKLNPALLARRCNRLAVVDRGDATANHDIERRRFMVIDCDPVRPSGISSSDAEHDRALAKAAEVAEYFRARGWPQPIETDSGNGAHLFYPIDLPSDDGGTVEKFLGGVAKQFDDDKVKIDVGIHNAARLIKLPGTRAGKGDSIPNRPHRMAHIISAPDELEGIPW